MDYGALIQAAFGVIGELANQGKQQEAAARLKRLQTEVQGIPLPSLEEIQAQQLGPSAMSGVKVNPEYEAAQQKSLSQVGDVADNGLAQVDSATLNRLANQVSRRQQAGMANIEQDMAARGLAGSGLDYAARTQAASDANQRLSEAEQNTASEALQRRLQAAFGRGEMASKMRGQSWDEQAQQAKATDAINAANAQMRERASYYNANLPQQRFHNALAKVGAETNPTNAIAGLTAQQGVDTRQGLYGAGASISKFVDSASDDGTYTDENGYVRKKKGGQ